MSQEFTSFREENKTAPIIKELAKYDSMYL